MDERGLSGMHMLEAAEVDEPSIALTLSRVTFG